MDELRSVLDMNRPLAEQWKEKARKILTYDWIFSTPFEKIVVISSVLWSAFSLGKFLWGLL